VLHHPYGYAGFAVAGIWLIVAACSILSPDMITGSEHEHIPLAALTDWFSGAIASALVLTAVSRRGNAQPAVWAAVAVAISGIWIAVLLASTLSPSLVTGTDPTTIPIAAFIAPLIGAISTAFVCVFAAGAGSSE
jgi:hypothetical protein